MKLLNHEKMVFEPMVECDEYRFEHVTFTDKDIWHFIKAHTRLIDLLNPRKVSAISQLALYVLQVAVDKDPHSVELRENTNWKFKFEKNWKVK